MQLTLEELISEAIQRTAVVQPAPEKLVKSLDANTRRNEQGWVISLQGSPFDHAEATVQKYGVFEELRIEFSARRPGRLLEHISAFPQDWTVGPPFPDAGRRAIGREWTVSAAKLDVSCTSMIDGETPKGELLTAVTCFIAPSPQ